MFLPRGERRVEDLDAAPNLTSYLHCSKCSKNNIPQHHLRPMPVKRRTRVPRRGRRSGFRKRRITRRRRLVKRFKKRKNVSRRTRLTQGFPRSSVATLKYVDVVTDISPQTTFAADHPTTPLYNAPGILAFSCNDPGSPDLGSTDRSNFPTLYAIKGSAPHQPLGYDQYTMLYQNAKVLRSSAKFTVTFATRGGYPWGQPHQAIPPAAQFEQKGVESVSNHGGTQTGPIAIPGVGTAQVNTTTSVPVGVSAPLTQKFPAGMYVGIIRVNSFNPLGLPQTYTEYLERFKAPLKWVPYLQQMGGFKTVTLYGMYGAPSTKSLRAMVNYHDLTTTSGSHLERQADLLTTKTGDIPFVDSAGNTIVGRSGCRARPPQAQFAWKLVVYYPDKTGVYKLPSDAHAEGFIDAVSMRATVNIRYRVRFTKLRQLAQSYLHSTPGINEQPAPYGGGLPTSGGGTAPVTTTRGIIDQTGAPEMANPFTQKALPSSVREVPQA